MNYAYNSQWVFSVEFSSQHELFLKPRRKKPLTNVVTFFKPFDSETSRREIKNEHLDYFQDTAK